MVTPELDTVRAANPNPGEATGPPVHERDSSFSCDAQTRCRHSPAASHNNICYFYRLAFHSAGSVAARRLSSNSVPLIAAVWFSVRFFVFAYGSSCGRTAYFARTQVFGSFFHFRARGDPHQAAAIEVEVLRNLAVFGSFFRFCAPVLLGKDGVFRADPKSSVRFFISAPAVIPTGRAAIEVEVLRNLAVFGSFFRFCASVLLGRMAYFARAPVSKTRPCSSCLRHVGRVFMNFGGPAAPYETG
jgi:hypothetical protein